MNYTTIENAIYAWVVAALPGGTAVYWNEPDGPRPATPAVRLKLISVTTIGLDELRDLPESETEFDVVGPRAVTLSVTTYGDTALQAASDLQTSLSNPDVQAGLASGGVSVLSRSQIRDVSEALETKYEQRRNFDVEMLGTEQATIEPGTIEQISATGAIGGTTSGTPIAVPVSVDKTP